MSDADKSDNRKTPSKALEELLRETQESGKRETPRDFVQRRTREISEQDRAGKEQKQQ